ncbi:MAG: hypothetical protein ACYSWO_10655 [Planctomycetota bacterium]
MHEAIRPCSRALLNAGSKIAISSDMTEITTSNSINVNADIFRCRIAEASLNSFMERFLSIKRASIPPSGQDHYTSIITLLKQNINNICLSRKKTLLSSFSYAFFSFSWEKNAIFGKILFDLR